MRRRRKLARFRRRRDLQDQRVEERERQRRHRARGARMCHAPPSARETARLRAEMLESWDSAVALSRASLARRLPAIMRVSVQFTGMEAVP